MNRKTLGLKTSVSIVLFILITGNSFALMFANTLPILYQSNPDNKSESIDNFIVDGAGYFLNSYSDFLLLLNRVEISGRQAFDYNGAGLLASQTIKNLETLKSTYLLIIKQTAGVAYNTDVLKMLEAFDFEELIEKATLNPIILNEVKSYLIKGDANGIYYKIIGETEQLLNGLYDIRKQIEVGIFPDITGLWSLNQRYSNLMLFGQYVSMVCGKLAGFNRGSLCENTGIF